MRSASVVVGALMCPVSGSITRVSPVKENILRESLSGFSSDGQSSTDTARVFMGDLARKVAMDSYKTTDVDIETVQSIKDFISGIESTAMKEHEQDVQLLNSAVEQIGVCGLVPKQTRDAANQSKQDCENRGHRHGECRVVENKMHAEMSEACKAYRAYRMHEVKTISNDCMPDHMLAPDISADRATKPRKLKNMEGCLVNSADWLFPLHELYLKCKQHESDHDEKRKNCTAGQEEFEQCVCDYRAHMVSGCESHKKCYEEKVKEHGTLETQVRAREPARKADHVAGEKIKCYFGVLTASQAEKKTVLGECEALAPDTSQFDIAYSDVPAIENCSLPPSPCNKGWRTDHYLSRAWHTGAPPSQCNECSASADPSHAKAEPRSLAGKYQVWYDGRKTSDEVGVGCDLSVTPSYQLQTDVENRCKASDIKKYKVKYYIDRKTQGFECLFEVEHGLQGWRFKENGAWSAGILYKLDVPYPCAQKKSGVPEAESKDVFAQVIGAQFAMLPGSVLVSENGKYHFSFDEGGELAVTQREGGDEKKLWSANTGGKGGTKLILQGGDQHLVLYGPSGKVWSTGVYENGGCATRLVMQDDGNLVQYNSLDQPIWNTRTDGPQVSPHQGSGQQVTHDGCGGQIHEPRWAMPKLGEHMMLLPGGRLEAQEGEGFVAQLQEDGNFVVKGKNGNRVFWASNSAGGGGFQLALQGDQHLVLSGPDGAVWSTGVYGRDVATSPVRLVMQGDGNLCQRDARNTPMWCTGSNGPQVSLHQGGGIQLM